MTLADDGTTVSPPSQGCQADWLSTPEGRIYLCRWPGDDAQAPIVLFHDSLGCVELWRDFPDLLRAATGRTVIAYDRLGYGRSDARRQPPALDFIREEALLFFPLLLQQLALTRFVACGHSVGGAMAALCASESGAQCEALITISAQAFVDAQIIDGVTQAARDLRQPEQMARLRKYHGDKAEWVLKAWTDAWLSPEFADWSLAPDLPRILCPVLAIHGAEDEYGSNAHPQRIGSQCRGQGRVAILDGVGHLPHREQPAQVAELVRDFLQH